MRSVAAIVSVAASAAVVVAAGCGGVSLDPVAKAAAATQDEQTMRVDFDFSSASGTATTRGTGSGVFDNASKTGKLTMQVAANGQQVPVEVLEQGLVVYMRSPLLARQLPAGKTWLKLDLQKAAQRQGLDLQSLTGPRADDQLAQLRAASKVDELGPEQVAGVDTTPDRATVAFAKAAAGAKTRAQAETYRRLAKLTGSKTVPVDVWVDGNDHVRKLSESYSVTDPKTGKAVQTSMSMTFEDFGVPVDVRPPAPDTVVDALSHRASTA
jgi:hypothetical protein